MPGTLELAVLKVSLMGECRVPRIINRLLFPNERIAFALKGIRDIISSKYKEIKKSSKAGKIFDKKQELEHLEKEIEITKINILLFFFIKSLSRIHNYH